MNEIRSGERARGLFYLTASVLLMLMAVLSSYLLYTHYVQPAQSSLLFQICSVKGVFDCSAVNTTPYTSLLGVPLGGWGIFFSILQFFLMLLMLLPESASLRRLVLHFILLGAFAGFLAVFPLILISHFLIKAFCLFCILVWIVTILYFLLILNRVKREYDETLTASLIRLQKECLTTLRSGISLLLISLVVIFAAVLFASLFYQSRSMEASRQLELIAANQRMEEDLLRNFYDKKPLDMNLKNTPLYYGDAKARVVVVEYMNLDCHVCRRASPMMKSLVDKYPGKIRLYLKQYPLDPECNPYIKGNGKGFSCRASLLAIALSASPLYREYIRAFMSSNRDMDDDLMREIVGGLHLKQEQLNRMMPEEKARKILRGYIEEAESLGMDGTPTFVINGRALPSGLPPYYFLDRLIQMEIHRHYGGMR